VDKFPLAPQLLEVVEVEQVEVVKVQEELVEVVGE
jgi:hypothetical protein